MSLSLVVVLLGTAGISWLTWRLRWLGSRPPGLPPGPPTLPIIGNLHQMPKSNGRLQFQKWAEEYGPIYSLILGTQTMIVLSSDVVAKDLLDKRSSIYSSRPEYYLVMSIASGGLRFTLLPYGKIWRMLRRSIHSILNIQSSRTYVPYQDLENKKMLVDLLDQPKRFIDFIQRYTDSITTQMVFGFRMQDANDSRVQQMFDSILKITEIAGSTSAATLDVFPLLRRLPDIMVPMRSYARKLHRDEKKFYMTTWMNTKSEMEAGTARPCFCTELVKVQQAEDFSDDLAGYTSGVMHEAGSETSASSLISFVQAMVLEPEVQARARKQLDEVCGDRLPTMEDQPELPYIRACVKEVLRWMPILPMGLPHATIAEDEYMGYRIPKDAAVVLNTWAIHRDPVRFPNPERFDPSRFEGDLTTASESASNPDGTKRDHFAFGAGRRICPGIHVAERTLFLSVSRLLWAFNFDTVKDSDGNPIMPDVNDVSEGLIMHANKFPANITPRSEEHARKIREAWADCQVLLDEQGQWREVLPGMKLAGYTSEKNLGYDAPRS